jgi:hypothetical protein
MIVISLALRGYMMWENKRRDGVTGAVEGGEKGEKADERAVEDGFKDLTDRQSVYFRYAL